jgi:transcriptional regulator with XRE-family HTH domain
MNTYGTNTDPRTLGLAIREARLNALLTQTELAERAGLSRPTVAHIESGRYGSPLSIRRIAKVLDITLPEPAACAA